MLENNFFAITLGADKLTDLNEIICSSLMHYFFFSFLQNILAISVACLRLINVWFCFDINLKYCWLEKMWL